MKRLGIILSVIASLVLISPVSAYTVKAGDTLSRLSREFKVSIQEIAQKNNIDNIDFIRVGQELTFGESDEILGAGYTPVTGYSSRTTQYISSSATTIPVASTLDKSGEQIVLSNISPSGTVKVYMNLGAGTSSEEPIYCTGVTTVSWTGCVRGLAFQGSSETSSSTLAKAHNAGTSIIITNIGQFYNQYVSIDGTQSINDVKTFTSLPLVPTSTPTLGGQVISLYQFQQATTTGGINGSETAKGVYQLPTPSEAGSGTSIGSSGARLVLPSSMASSSRASNTSTVVITRGADGYIDSSFGGGVNSFATLNSSTLVIENPANATTTPTASKIPISDTSGELNTWLNQNRLNVQTYVAGENIDASSTPQALYLKQTDGRVYKLNATSATEAAYAFTGFAIIQSAVTTGNNILVQTDGLVSGFTGLTIGGYYYGTNTAGTISTTAGTISLQVGRAVSANTVLIQIGKKFVRSSATFSNTTTSTVTIGFRPARILVTMAAAGVNRSIGGWEATSGNYSIYTNVSSASQAISSNAWQHSNGGNNYGGGTIINITSTGFTLNSTHTGSGGDQLVSWEAEG